MINNNLKIAIENLSDELKISNFDLATTLFNNGYINSDVIYNYMKLDNVKLIDVITNIKLMKGLFYNDSNKFRNEIFLKVADYQKFKICNLFSISNNEFFIDAENDFPNMNYPLISVQSDSFLSHLIVENRSKNEDLLKKFIFTKCKFLLNVKDISKILNSDLFYIIEISKMKNSEYKTICNVFYEITKYKINQINEMEEYDGIKDILIQTITSLKHNEGKMNISLQRIKKEDMQENIFYELEKIIERNLNKKLYVDLFL